jgi:hypothetical protein
MTLQCFASNGTLHKTVWIASPTNYVPSGISSGAALRFLNLPTEPHFHYDLYTDGTCQYSAPSQGLKMASLFIGDTPLIFTHK